jgi:CheY-like chemotaxis protein
MRALLVIEDTADRESLARTLRRAGFYVVAVGDSASAVASVVRDAPESVVFSWAAGTTFVRDVRAAATGNPHILALLDPASAGGISRVLAAGVHDVLIRPFVDSELIGRLQAVSRTTSRHVPPPPAEEAALASFDVRRLAIWKNLGPLVAADLSEMAGQELRATPGWPSNIGQPLRCATVPLSLVNEGLELLVSVAADPKTQAWLGRALLEEPAPDEAAMNDALRELASMAGGALKRMGLRERVAMTIGLPVNVRSIAPSREKAIAFAIRADREEAPLAILAEVRDLPNKVVRASQLEEGMVVVHDVRTPNGMLLVTAGSRLTRTTAERLRRLLGTKSLMEVTFQEHR